MGWQAPALPFQGQRFAVNRRGNGGWRLAFSHPADKVRKRTAMRRETGDVFNACSCVGHGDRKPGRSGSTEFEPGRGPQLQRPNLAGFNGRYRCKRPDGTVGLIVGAAGGALLGRAIDTKGERATGTILGAAAGALIGRKIDRSRVKCK
jgi:hypothetical protein